MLDNQYLKKKSVLAFLIGLAFLAATTLSHAEKLYIKSEPFTNFHKDSSSNRFGKLTFIGGLVLTSEHEDFGGISAIRFVQDNNFIAVTDKARVITGRLERKDGKPSSIKGERITRIKAANGKTITGAEDKDAESLEIIGNQFLVGYERNDRIKRLNMRGRKLVTDPTYSVDLNPFEFPNNKGPEAIAWDSGTQKLLAFAEYALNDAGNHRGFIIANGTVEKEISVKQRNGFSLTDAAFLPNGDLLFLERYYNPFTGAFMRLRQIKKKDIYANEILDGEILVDFDRKYEIDNQEAMALSPMPDGSTRLTLVSDDNFSKSQRTLLLEFRFEN